MEQSPTNRHKCCCINYKASAISRMFSRNRFRTMKWFMLSVSREQVHIGIIHYVCRMNYAYLLCNDIFFYFPCFQFFPICCKKGLQNGPSTSLRLRRSLDYPENPLNLRYMGVPNTDAKKMVLSRTCIDCNCSHEIHNFLSLMGFVKDYEYIMKGHIFRKGGMKI